MANNRMYLVCRACNKEFMLAKTFSQGYYTMDDSSFQDRLDIFLDEHNYCNKYKDVNSQNQFELVYETSYEEGIKELITKGEYYNDKF